MPAAGKTGTTGVQAGSPTVSFAGYTPQMAAVAIIAGVGDTGQPIVLEGQTIGGNYISSVSGSGFAAPIWGDAMKVDRRHPRLRRTSSIPAPCQALV